jgi:ureidoglycolate amidohydrolase
MPPSLPLSIFSLAILVLQLTIPAGASGDNLLALGVNATLVLQQLNELKTFSDVAAPAVTRIMYTPRDVEARAYLRGLIRGAGLELREDAIGNIFARLPGSDGSSAVGTGSHYDAIPSSGMYDGTLGVLGGLEAMRALRDAGFRPRKSLELLAFTGEEPTRFQLSCVGSRALVGNKSPEDLAELRDMEGVSFDEARAAAGLGAGDLSAVELPSGYYSAFVELHIEQGRRLEDGGLDIGTRRAGSLSPALVTRNM